MSEQFTVENLNSHQVGLVEIEWPQTDLSEFEELDTANAISEAHDDPC